MYLIGFDTDLDGVVDDTFNGDEDLHRPVTAEANFVILRSKDDDSSKTKVADIRFISVQSGLHFSGFSFLVR